MAALRCIPSFAGARVNGEVAPKAAVHSKRSASSASREPTAENAVYAQLGDRDVPEKDILVVDDDAEVRKVLAAILQDEGYGVELAATLAEARKLLGEYRYRVVLADWRLPDGDGSLLANLAREAGSHAFVMSGYLAHLLPGSLDPRQTLMKPILRAGLLATVHACIGMPTPDIITAPSGKARRPNAPS
jgi:CheY-like chemotaxis protein